VELNDGMNISWKEYKNYIMWRYLCNICEIFVQ
jgi:hypothetical protein